MDNQAYRLKYILCGASGSGKTTMASVLEEQLGMRRCVTSTTRPPREGEEDGISYHFVPHINPKEMFEHTSFGGFDYGISKDELKRGDFVILDPQGVKYYRHHYPNPLTVIQLVRQGIDVAPERIARDRAAGFDRVDPDYFVKGETIFEMAENLISTIRRAEAQTYCRSETALNDLKDPQEKCYWFALSEGKCISVWYTPDEYDGDHFSMKLEERGEDGYMGPACELISDESYWTANTSYLSLCETLHEVCDDAELNGTANNAAFISALSKQILHAYGFDAQHLPVFTKTPFDQKLRDACSRAESLACTNIKKGKVAETTI